MFRAVCVSGFFTIVGAFFVYGSTFSLLAQVMESGNFKMQSDSVNFGGGLSTSTNYALESTAGEVGSGLSSSTNFALSAGYQQMQPVTISLTGATAVVMSPDLGGVTGGTANGSTTVNVTTDNPLGYSLSIASFGSPAMQAVGGATIANYAPAGAPDYTFFVTVGAARFGYTPEGVHIVNRFKDNGLNTCNTGSADGTATCWDGLSTTTKTVASSNIANYPLGSTTTVRFRVGVGANAGVVPGLYTATTTLTAIAL